jgi:hypothetical protein
LRVLEAETAILSGPTIICPYCQALKWEHETKGLCCQLGKVVLKTEWKSFPKKLKGLFDDAEFQQHIRAYNAAFSFTSLGAKEMPSKGGGVPSFRVQGQVMHRIGSLLPEKGPPHYCQMYFFDTDFDSELEARSNVFGNLDGEKLSLIQSVLHEVNPYVKLL